MISDGTENLSGVLLQDVDFGLFLPNTVLLCIGTEKYTFITQSQGICRMHLKIEDLSVDLPVSRNLRRILPNH